MNGTAYSSDEISLELENGSCQEGARSNGKVNGQVIENVRQTVIGTGLLMLPGLAAASDFATDVYSRERLDLRVEVANNRVLDGLEYYDDNGVASLGIRFTDPGGVYLASQFLHGHGDGNVQADTAISSLESAVGWATTIDEHFLALELQDYRQWQDVADNPDYQGVALSYGIGSFQAEFGFEFDRPFHYRRLYRYFEYDTRRLVLGWNVDIDENLALQLGAGSSEIDRLEIRYEYLSARLHWRWRDLDWSLSLTTASDDVERLYSPETDRTSVTVGVAWKFDLL